MPSAPIPPDPDWVQEEARRRFAERLDAYRKVAQHYRWPGVTLDPAMEDFYIQKQDRQRGPRPTSGRQGLRLIEEMTVYAEDGTMLGSLTLSAALVQVCRGVPAWLTPAFIHTTITREDLVRAHGRQQ